MNLIYHYVGFATTWLVFFTVPVVIGYWLATSVISLGGWKPWVDDFFGLKEDQK